MEAVNLLPVEYRDRKRSRAGAAERLDGRTTLRLGGVVVLLFAVLIAGLYLHERSLVHSKQKDLAQENARIAAVQAQVDAIQAAQLAASARLGAASAITSTRMNWDHALRDFARILPTNAYLTSLSLKAPTPTAGLPAATPGSTPAPAVGASALTISGVATSTPAVALVMDRLSLLPWLNGVTLSSAARAGDGTNTFNMTANVTEEH